MPDIHIRRDHELGLTKARKLAWTWAEQAEAKFEMECNVVEGADSDVVEFKRSGVSGQLLVAADHFTIDAKLGFLLGAFSKTIEAEITKNLDGLLDGEGSVAAPTPAPTVRPASDGRKSTARSSASKGSK